MRDGGDLEDTGWIDIEDAPIAAEHGATGRNEQDAVVTTEGFGVIVPRKVPEPRTPAPDVVARHNLTHLPYASWCPHCVAARRANNPHFQTEESYRRMIPLLVLDYCFIRNTQDEDLLTVLVGRLYPTRTLFACPVDMKGRDPVAISRLGDFIKSNGLTKFVYKCDQERALDALNQEVISDVFVIADAVEEAARRVGRSASPVEGDDARIAVPEHSPVGESQSNGKAERSVQTVEDQIRTVKLALESRIGARIPSNHSLMHWIVLHSADILNKYTVNKIGMSPYEETHGQRSPERRVEFGERVFYFVYKKNRTKLDPRWRLGIYLGHSGNSNEAYVGVTNGNVRRTRTVVRVVAEARWSKELVQRIAGTPSDMLPITDGELGGDEIEADERPHETREVVVEDADDVPGHSTQVPRRVRITKLDLARHGFTPGCPRCAELELGRVDSVKNHNAVCRARMYNKFETEKHEKYTKVRAERDQAQRENSPMPNFVDLDAADYDRWLSREAAGHAAPMPGEQRPDEDSDAIPPEAKRARTGPTPSVRKVDRDCDFDEATGLYVPTEDFRSRFPEPSDDRDWRYPPSDHQHYRGLQSNQDDDEEVPEPDTKRARVFSMTMNVLKSAGVSEGDAEKYCNAIMGSADAGTFVEVYGRGSIMSDANGPRRSLGIKGLNAFDMRTLKPDGGNWDFNKAGDRKLAMKLVQGTRPRFYDWFATVHRLVCMEPAHELSKDGPPACQDSHGGGAHPPGICCQALPTPAGQWKVFLARATGNCIVLGREMHQ